MLDEIWVAAINSGYENLLVPLAYRCPTPQSVEALYPLVRTTDGHALVKRDGPETAFSLLLQATQALATLHKSGYCHRDIKPDNVFIEAALRSELWGNSRAIIADLGLAARIAADGEASVASGTLGYIAPEILEGKTGGRESDLFSLGMWLYWLITGKEPLRGQSISESIRATHEFTRLPMVSRVDSRFAGGFWDDVLTWLTNKKPEARPRDAEDFQSHLVEASVRVLSESGAVAEVLWNGTVPTCDERAQIDKLVREVVAEPGHQRIHTFRLERPELSRVVYQRLRLALRNDGFESLLLHPDYGFTKALNLLSEHPSSLIVLDNTIRVGKFGADEIRALDAAIRLETTLATRFVVLESDEQGYSGPHGEALDSHQGDLGSAHGDISQHRLWVSQLFAGTEIGPGVHEIVERHAGLSSSATVAGIRRLLDSRSIVISGKALVLLESRALASRWHLKESEGLTNRSESQIEAQVSDLFRGQPNGLPLKLIEAVQSSLMGFAGAVRHLMERGVLAIDRENGALCSRPLATPELSESGLPVGKMSSLASLVLDVARRYSEIEIDEPTILALRIRSNDWNKAVVSRAVASARRLLYKGQPQQALAMCYSLVRGMGSTMAPLLWARCAFICAKSLSFLGERAHLGSLWESAKKAAIAARRFDLAARIELEAQLSMISRVPGFTGSAMKLLDRGGPGSWPYMRAELALEELSIWGWHNGFSGRQKDAEEFVKAGSNSARCLAVAKFCLMKAAEEQSDNEAYVSHSREAIEAAELSSHARTLSKVLSYAAGYELVRGRVNLGRDILSRLDVIPRLRFATTDLVPILSTRGGIEFEGGNLRAALETNRELLSLAIASSHSRLETNTRRNIGLVCLAMNRLGDALDSLGLRNSERTLSGYWDIRVHAAILLEIGQIAEAEELLQALYDSSVGLSRFQRADITAKLAQASFLRGDLAQGIERIDDAFRLHLEEGALDEQLKAVLIGAWHVPSLQTESAKRISARDFARAGHTYGQGRVWREFRVLTVARLSERSAATARRRADALLAELRASGEGRLELELLYSKALLEKLLGDRASAADTIRDAMKLLRQTADGLAGYGGMREIYLADPRRQRFLKLARALKES